MPLLEFFTLTVQEVEFCVFLEPPQQLVFIAKFNTECNPEIHNVMIEHFDVLCMFWTLSFFVLTRVCLLLMVALLLATSML